LNSFLFHNEHYIVLFTLWNHSSCLC